VIEARWLFDVPAERIEVVLHPQSIVHSVVEFVDGSLIAQMSPNDMRFPVLYALTYPDRIETPLPRLDLPRSGSWSSSGRKRSGIPRFLSRITPSRRAGPLPPS